MDEGFSKVKQRNQEEKCSRRKEMSDGERTVQKLKRLNGKGFKG